MSYTSCIKCVDHGGFVHLACGYLSDHALRHIARVQRIIQAQTPDVGMRANALNSSQVADFRCKLDVSHLALWREAVLKLTWE